MTPRRLSFVSVVALLLVAATAQAQPGPAGSPSAPTNPDNPMNPAQTPIGTPLKSDERERRADEPPPEEGPAQPLDADAAALERELLEQAQKQAEAVQPEKPAPTAVQPDKPSLQFFEVTGYFRFRSELYNNLDLGTLNRYRPLGDHYRVDSSAGEDAGALRAGLVKGGTSTLAGANMRLRLQPTLNVFDGVKVMAQIDMLDNLVLGSTPDSFDARQSSPNYVGWNAFSATTIPMRTGINANRNSIEVKRAWTEIRTPIGLFRIGRQPSHWGLGMYVNDGNGLNANVGDTVDRVAFATKLFNHVIFGTFDFPSDGVTNEIGLLPTGQWMDATQLDDVYQFAFGVLRKDTDAEIEERLLAGKPVFNYGTYHVIRTQRYDMNIGAIGPGQVASPDDPGISTVTEQTKIIDRKLLFRRDIFMWIGDVWFKFMYENFRLELEGVVVWGSAGNGSLADFVGANWYAARDNGTQIDKLRIFQYGFVAQTDYKFYNRQMRVALEYALASGDEDEGWGVYPLAPITEHPSGNPQFDRSPPNPATYKRNFRVTNFRFDPDYQVGLLLFPQILGTVTDAMYVKGTFNWNTAGAPMFGARLDLIYALAMEGNSTQSFNRYILAQQDGRWIRAGRKPSRDLGFELNAGVFLNTADNVRATLTYGLFVPGSAFGYWREQLDDNGNIIPERSRWTNAQEVAQTIQGNVYITF